MTWGAAVSLGSIGGIDNVTELFLPSDGTSINLEDAFQTANVMLELKPNTATPSVPILISIYPRLVQGSSFADEPARRFEIIPINGNAFNRIPITVAGIGFGFRIGLLALSATHTYDAQGSYALDE